ncbi:MAG: hypothetical protein QXW35_04080 [Candidatus Aenigmatarchaeota archaeon]
MKLNTRIDVRFTEEEYNWIDYISVILNCSKAEAVRWMINTMRMILNTGEWNKINELAFEKIYNENYNLQKVIKQFKEEKKL